MLRIIILGGGFAGVKCAKTLRRALRPAEAEVVIFNQENHLVFSPLLADAVGSSLNPFDVVVPLREMLPGVICRTEQVLEIDRAKSEVEFESESGSAHRLHYDHLVIACGNVTDLSIVPGMSDHAFPLKTVGDATALRSHVLERMERAEVCDDEERKRWYLTFLIVGGGYSGVEVAGEINDLVRSSARHYRNFTSADANVTLIHSRDQLLPEIGTELREFARHKMEQSGVKLILNARVALATHEGVGFKTGEFLRGGTIVCTIGSSTAPVIERLEATKEKGRLVTQADMRLADSPNVWSIGDCALIVNAVDGKPSPPTGQFAERQGRQCADNIAALVRGKPTKPFSFKVLGQLCSIGGHSAVGEMMGVRLSGIVAWFVWRGVYLFKLPSWSRRTQVGFDWFWLLLFPRDLSHVRTRETDRVTHAHYAPGDFVFRQGDMPANFYVIDRGEVEIVRTTAENPDGQVVAVLGPGSFFGEQALLNNAPRNASPRARTKVEVVVMGRNVFSQISKALIPLRDALAQTLNRRSNDVWSRNQRAREVLEQTEVRSLMESAPLPFLAGETTLREVARAFVDTHHDFLLVCDAEGLLEGIVTMTDLVRAHGAGGGSVQCARDFMVRSPYVVCPEDSSATAESVLREHQLKSLPVVASPSDRRVVGCLRIRRLIAHVMQDLNPV